MKAISDMIIAAVTHKRQNMHPDGRLYVEMGEAHPAFSHTLAQSVFLDNLHAQTDVGGFNPHGKIMMALEISYDSLQNIATRDFGINMPDDMRAQLHNKDPLGQLFLKASINAYQKHSVYHHNTNLYMNCLHHGEPVCLADLGHTDNNMAVDVGDPMTQKIAQDRGVDLSSTPLLTYPGHAASNWPKHFPPKELGCEFRNSGLSRRTINAAEEWKAKTIVIKMGLAHVGGQIHKNHQLPYETSVTADLKSRIRPQDEVLSINFNCLHDGREFVDTVPAEMWDNNPDHIIIRNVSKISEGTHDFFDALDAFKASYTDKGYKAPNCFSLNYSEQQQPFLETQTEIIKVTDDLGYELGYIPVSP
jgi:hypothetical protein